MQVDAILGQVFRRNLEEILCYIQWKHQFYDDVLNGKIEYCSNLIDTEKEWQKSDNFSYSFFYFEW